MAGQTNYTFIFKEGGRKNTELFVKYVKGESNPVDIVMKSIIVSAGILLLPVKFKR